MCAVTFNHRFLDKYDEIFNCAYFFNRSLPQGTSKKDKLHRRLSLLYNTSIDNVDVFTVSNKRTVKDQFLDVRFSAHGSPYYPPEKLDSMVTGIQEKVRIML